MENYIVIGGKRAELTPEQLEKLGVAVEKNPFERVLGTDYYIIDDKGVVDFLTEDNEGLDDDYYSIANYCTDETLMKQRAMHETLDRLLWRFTHENGWSEDLWNYIGTTKYKISYGIDKFYIDTNSEMKNYCTYFKDKQTAQRAIDEIIKPFMEQHPDFVW